MARRYDQPIEVRRGIVDGAEAPEQFLWRERLYVVRRVLAHWVETGDWWRSAAARAVYGIDQEANGPPGIENGALSAHLAVLDDDEREVWRVEAAAGRHRPLGVFDLAFAWSTGHWVLLRSHD